MSDTLFGKWLEKTRELQVNFYGHDPQALEGEERAQFFKDQGFATLCELVEMGDEIGWKSWATSRHLNRETYIGEGVDVLHFVANLLLLAGCTDEELDRRYLEKMQKNRDRMIRGYDGLAGKCPNCKRDLLDSGVQCYIIKDAGYFCERTGIVQQSST